MFVFFGLVATAGTTFAAIEDVTGLSIVMGCAVGFAGLCAAGDQQPARHPDRPRGRQADARGAPRRPADPLVLRRADRGRAFVLCAVAAVWRVPGAARARSPSRWRSRRSERCSERRDGPRLIAVLGATGRLQLAWRHPGRRRLGLRRLRQLDVTMRLTRRDATSESMPAAMRRLSRPAPRDGRCGRRRRSLDHVGAEGAAMPCVRRAPRTSCRPRRR